MDIMAVRFSGPPDTGPYCVDFFPGHQTGGRGLLVELRPWQPNWLKGEWLEESGIEQLWLLSPNGLSQSGNDDDDDDDEDDYL
eukprot:239333-Lingulodinium_polyedra.AAC.1